MTLRMRVTRHAWIRQRRVENHARMMLMEDVDLVAALAMVLACDEPLRVKLGLKTDRDCFFVIGFRQAIAQYGGLTYKQRQVARRMVEWAMNACEIGNKNREDAKRVGLP